MAMAILALHISVLGRGLVPMLGAACFVTLLLLVTFDLDRPTRGLITVATRLWSQSEPRWSGRRRHIRRDSRRLGRALRPARQDERENIITAVESSF
jgi:hypothetical protein